MACSVSTAVLSCPQVGHAIPFQQLGFLHLEAFLRSLPDVCSLEWRAGQLTVLGVASLATAHVQVCPPYCPVLCPLSPHFTLDLVVRG